MPPAHQLAPLQLFRILQHHNPQPRVLPLLRRFNRALRLCRAPLIRLLPLCTQHHLAAQRARQSRQRPRPVHQPWVNRTRRIQPWSLLQERTPHFNAHHRKEFRLTEFTATNRLAPSVQDALRGSHQRAISRHCRLLETQAPVHRPRDFRLRVQVVCRRQQRVAGWEPAWVPGLLVLPCQTPRTALHSAEVD